MFHICITALNFYRLPAGGLCARLASTAWDVLHSLAGSTGSSLLCCLVSLSLLCAFLDLAESSLAGSLAGLGLLSLLLGDNFKRSTTNGAGGSTGNIPALLTCHLLLEILAMLLAVKYGPCNLGRTLTLVEHGLAFLLEEEELLAIYTDEKHSLTRVDLQAAKAACLGPAIK